MWPCSTPIHPAPLTQVNSAVGEEERCEAGRRPAEQCGGVEHVQQYPDQRQQEGQEEEDAGPGFLLGTRVPRPAAVGVHG